MFQPGFLSLHRHLLYWGTSQQLHSFLWTGQNTSHIYLTNTGSVTIDFSYPILCSTGWYKNLIIMFKASTHIYFTTNTMVVWVYRSSSPWAITDFIPIGQIKHGSSGKVGGRSRAQELNKNSYIIYITFCDLIPGIPVPCCVLYL